MAERVVVTPEAAPAATPGAPNVEVTETTHGVQVTPGATEQPPVKDDKAGDRPKWLPEKFKTAEEMAQSYAELEKKLGAPTKGEQATPETAKAAIKDAGFDMAALSEEYAQNDGKLTDATLNSLKEKGITPEAVNTYIAGQKAIADKTLADIAGVVGGQEEYGKMQEWAKANVPAEEVEAFNAAILSGNTALAKLAVQGLAQQYRDAVGTEPTVTFDGESVTTSGVDAFRSTDEVTRAMSDPRYKTDPAYRNDVTRRLAASKVW